MEKIRVALAKDPAALGERLLIIGSGPIAVPGAQGGVIALNERGAAVLVAAFSSLAPGAAGELAVELDRLGQLTGNRLAEVATELPVDQLEKVHRATFDRSSGRKISFNTAQRVIVIVNNQPGLESWKELRTELGPQLLGVHVLDSTGRLQPLAVPDLLRKTERGRSFKRWIAATAAVCLLAGLVIGRLLPERNRGQSGAQALVSAASVVAPLVPADATHNGWIGQRRVVRTSTGHLIAAYSGPDGLMIVTDQANQGRSWELPQVVAGVQSRSFGMAIDSSDRLHVAFQDSGGIGYVHLRQSLTGIVSSPVVRIDPTSTSPVVDVAFDAAQSVAHVAYVKQEPGAGAATLRQQPAWSAVAAPADADPSLIGSQTLAEPGKAISVLTNIGVAPGSRVIATYRRGDSVNGWFARYLDAANPAAFAWSEEQPLPVADALYGAGSMAVAPGGNAHVVLRDNTTYGLTYLMRRADGTWSPAETSVDADVTEQIDFPSISADLTSEAVFVFFQDTTSVAQGEIKAVTRDPSSGWGSPSVVASGSALPTSIELAAGVSIVLGTNTGTGSVTANRVGLN